jgi:hypothetical protein
MEDGKIVMETVEYDPFDDTLFSFSTQVPERTVKSKRGGSGSRGGRGRGGGVGSVRGRGSGGEREKADGILPAGAFPPSLSVNSTHSTTNTFPSSPNAREFKTKKKKNPYPSRTLFLTFSNPDSSWA